MAPKKRKTEAVDALPPGRPDETPVDPAAAEKCARCQAACCRTVAIHLDPPTRRRGIDSIIWYLHHRDVRVGITVSGDWLVEFPTPCLRLGLDYRCTIYEERPQICRDYGGENRKCEFDRPPYRQLFTSPEEFQAYLGRDEGVSG